MRSSTTLSPIGFSPAEISAMTCLRVIEQHAEEAAFLWVRRHAAIHAPHYDLADLARLDETVEAHLDGLRVAGDVGWKESLKLVGHAPEYVFPLSALAFGGENREQMRDAFNLGCIDADTRSAMLSALGWLDYSAIEPFLRALLGAPVPLYRQIGIAAFATHRINPDESVDGVILKTLLNDPDADLRARALRAAGELGRIDLLSSLQIRLDDKNDACRFWAAWSLCRMGYREAVMTIETFAVPGSPYWKDALQIGLRCASPLHRSKWMNQMVATPGFERLAVFSAGVIGDPALLPWLVRAMKSVELARIAGESFSSVTGVDLEYDDLDTDGPELDEETKELSSKLEASMDDADLPWPAPELISSWLAEKQHAFSSGVRYLGGQPITIESANIVLRTGTQRHRAAAALELAVRKTSQPLFNVRERGKRQQKRLATCGS